MKHFLLVITAFVTLSVYADLNVPEPLNMECSVGIVGSTDPIYLSPYEPRWHFEPSLNIQQVNVMFALNTRVINHIISYARFNTSNNLLFSETLILDRNNNGSPDDDEPRFNETFVDASLGEYRFRPFYFGGREAVASCEWEI